MNDSDAFAGRLHAQGYRLTPQRIAILRILTEAARHFTPGEIFEQAQQALPGITEATVYRTLNFLVEQGLALPAHLGNGQYAYEYAGHNHHHLICRGCGESLEIDQQALTDLYRHFQATTGFRIDTVHLTFFGLCPGCQDDHSN